MTNDGGSLDKRRQEQAGYKTDWEQKGDMLQVSLGDLNESLRQIQTAINTIARTEQRKTRNKDNNAIQKVIAQFEERTARRNLISIVKALEPIKKQSEVLSKKDELLKKQAELEKLAKELAALEKAQRAT